ncbi:hypothetical protein N9L68_04435 [bacterium]|nr:hypothetical protein [bacterium]
MNDTPQIRHNRRYSRAAIRGHDGVHPVIRLFQTSKSGNLPVPHHVRLIEPGTVASAAESATTVVLPAPAAGSGDASSGAKEVCPRHGPCIRRLLLLKGVVFEHINPRWLSLWGPSFQSCLEIPR